MLNMFGTLGIFSEAPLACAITMNHEKVVETNRVFKDISLRDSEQKHSQENQKLMTMEEHKTRFRSSAVCLREIVGARAK